MSVLSVNAEYLRLATLFVDHAGKFPGRPNLDAVRVEPCPEGGAVIVGTDSEHMIVIFDKDAKVPAPAAIRVPLELRMELQGETILDRVFQFDPVKLMASVRKADDTDVSYAQQKAPNAVQLDAPYVTWRKLHLTEEIFKGLSRSWPGAMNCDFLKKVATLYKSMGVHRDVDFLHNGHSQGVYYLLFPWRPEMYVVIAQLVDRKAPQLPDWLADDIPF